MKVAVFYDSTNYGVSGRDDLMNQIKKQGDKLEVVASEKWNIGDKDMTAQLLKAKALGAQAILIWGIGPELAAKVDTTAVVQEFRKLGLSLDDIEAERILVCISRFQVIPASVLERVMRDFQEAIGKHEISVQGGREQAFSIISKARSPSYRSDVG